MQHRKLSLYRLRHLGTLALAVCVTLLLSASHTPTALETVHERGELRIISRNGPTTYYEGRQGLDGYEYTLAKAFAEHLGVELAITEEENFSNFFHGVGTDRGQLAAAGLSITKERSKQVRFTRPYMQVHQELLYRTGTKRPLKVEDLLGKSILVISNSAHAERLRELQKDHPQLRWHEQSDLEMVDLMEMVHTGTIDFAIIDSNAYDINRSLYPRARRAFTISQAPKQLAWVFPQSVDNSLYALADAFIGEAQSTGMLSEMRERYYGHVNGMDAGSALTFARRVESRLPRWQDLLQKAGEDFDIDWQLLAAISYQESHWNSRATSYTGVRGLMMLTKTTAAEVGVDDRLDPAQSIHGGAKYFKKIFKRIPQSIQGADRTWMALAAYNIGFGHLEDARILTERMDGNPDKWVEVRKHLPLLAKRKYYKTTKHGYARGSEPVKYVKNIRSFYSTIALRQHVEQRRLAAIQDNGIMPVNFEAIDRQTTSLL